MEYIKKDLGSYNLHVIRTDKFKTVMVRVVFQRPVVKNEITMRNVLSQMLLQSTYKYKTKRDMNINVKGFIKETYYLNIKTIDNNTKNIISNLYGEFTDTGRNSSQIQDIVKVKMQYFIEENLNELLR